MLTGLPLPWEILLLAVFAFALVFVVRAVQRRRQFAAPSTLAASELPNIETEQRVRGTIRRIFRDPAQGLWLVTAQVGPARYTFCATDYEASKDRYEALTGQPTDLALFALSTLEPGGTETIRHQIKDADKIALTPETVALTQAGEYPNDYAVIGKVLSSHTDTWDDMPLAVYRTQVVNRPDLTLILDLAVPQQQTNGAAPQLAAQTMVHGSARLFGRLAG